MRILLLLLLLTACKTKVVYTDNFCLWFEPLTMTQEEVKLVTDKTLLDIYAVNQQYEEQCK